MVLKSWGILAHTLVKKMIENEYEIKKGPLMYVRFCGFLMHLCEAPSVHTASNAIIFNVILICLHLETICENHIRDIVEIIFNQELLMQ